MPHPLAINGLRLGDDFIGRLDEVHLDKPSPPQQSRQQPFGYRFRRTMEPGQARTTIKDMKYDPETQLTSGTIISKDGAVTTISKDGTVTTINRDGTIRAAGGGGTGEPTETQETIDTSLDGVVIEDPGLPDSDELLD